MHTATQYQIDSFLVNFPRNIIEILYYREEDQESTDIEISLDWVCECLIKNEPLLIQAFKVYNREMKVHEIEWFYLMSAVEENKKLQLDILNDYLK